MGAQVDRDSFADADYEAFAARLVDNLAVLRETLDTPGFGAGPATIGAEVEASLVDADGRVAGMSRAVQDRVHDPRIVSELAHFNIEANLGVQPCTGHALAALEAELRAVLTRIDRAAVSLGGRLVAAGIVPSVEVADVGPAAVTDETRYHALENGLDRVRGRPITLHVDGPEPLTTQAASVAVEGASTSWQVHLRVPPERFRATFDAARMATVVALAACGNAPFFGGHRLWDETRVALFRQAVDARRGTLPLFARVGFGEGWLATGPYELFEVAARHHPAVIPVLSDRPPAQDRVAGGAPALAELRMHLGTVYSWVRPVYDPVDGGHVRMELRALPSGPTATDVLAGTALLLGLTFALARSADDLVERVPFAQAQRGFADAARRGLDAELPWPSDGGGLVRMRARDLVSRLLPVAQEGLDSAGLHRGDTAPRLEVLADRLRKGQTGAAWMTRRAGVLEQDLGRREALRRLTLEYAQRSADGAPVHTWPTD